MAASKYFEKEASLEKKIKDVESNGKALFLWKRQNALVKKGEKLDWHRRLDREKRDLIQKKEIETGEVEKQRDAQLREDEQQFAKNVLQLKNEEILKEKRRQLLRTNSPELRKLESQLLANRVAEIQRKQVLEKEAIKAEEKLREVQHHRDIEAWKISNNIVEREACERYRRKIQYRHDQQDQIIYKEWKRMAEDEERIRDQKLLDEAEDALREDLIKVARVKAETAARLQAEARMFLSAKEMWKAEEKKKVVEEEKRIAQTIYEKECEEKKRFEEAALRQKQKDIAADALAKELVRKDNSRKGLENIFNEASFLDVEERYQEKDRKEAEEEKRKSAYIREAMWEVHEMRREKARKDKEDEDAHVKYLKDHMEAAEKAARAKELAKRKKGIQYGEDLKAAIEDNAVVYAMNVARRQELARREEQAIAAERLDIEIERANMLREYGPIHGL